MGFGDLMGEIESIEDEDTGGYDQMALRGVIDDEI
jgi:hypothetical protein